MVDSSIFKAYDIRATYPDQINKEVAYQIGRAFVDYLKVDEVAVGRDMRISSDEIFEGLTQGINDGGAKVIDLGLVGTEMLYFGVGEHNFQSGIMITASHNPAKYNGLKMVSKGAYPIGSDSGLEQIRNLLTERNYAPTNSPKEIERLDIYPEYKNKIINLIDLTNIKKFKIVIDAANGMGGKIFENVFGDLDLDIVKMYFDLDGNFPNHESNPIKEENTAELRKRVVEEKADFGIALDGDGDRIFFIDEKGEYSSGYFMVAIIAQELLKKYPGAKIVHENRLEWAIIDTLAQAKGIPLRCKPGHSYIKEMMRKEDAVFGGENSSHFYYKDMHYADSSMLTTAILLKLLSDTGLNLSELLANYKSKYFTSGEINFKVVDADEILNKIQDNYSSKGYVLDLTDGIAFDNDRLWHFSIRKSNTEPVVRLNIEANSQEMVEKMIKELETQIGGERE